MLSCDKKSTTRTGSNLHSHPPAATRCHPAQVLRHGSPGDRVKDPDGFVERSTAQPGAALIGRVRAYSGYREDTSCPMHRWEVPAGELNLIVSFGDGFRSQAIPVVGSPGGISPPGSHGVNSAAGEVQRNGGRPGPTAHPTGASLRL